MVFRQSLLAVSTAALASSAFSQTVLLREDDPAPGGAPGFTISSIGNTAVNQTGGYACTLNVGDGTTSISQVWGDLSGGVGALIREEGVFGTLTQTSFETFLGISGAEVAYSPNCDDSAGSTGLDGVWLDGSVIGIEEMMLPGSTEFLSFGSRPGSTQSGEPYFVGGITDTVGGSTQGRALFYGAGLTQVYRTGVTYPNLPAALSTASVDFDFRFSANGTHNITPLDLDTSATDDGCMAIDGAGLVLGGTLVREAEAIPVSVGGNGEAWDNFDFCGINEAGDYFFTGDTDAAATNDEFIVRNGMIVVREGDTVDGEILTGAIEGAFLNEQNQLAYIWDVVQGTGNVEALFLDDELLLKEGDGVDWDGDGMVDPGAFVTNFTGISSLTVSPTGSVYFTADVDVNGTVLEGYFRIGDDGFGTNYCTAAPNSTGMPGVTAASGSIVVATNIFVLEALKLPSNQFGIFVTSMTSNPGTPAIGSNGILCLGGAIGRFTLPSQIVNSGAGGAFSLNVDLNAFPQGMGTVPVMSGQTWFFQAWHRDNVGLGSNFTDGLEILFL